MNPAYAFRLSILLACVYLGDVTLDGATPPAANYDEAKIPAYTLPNPLVSTNGRQITSSRDWRDVRRREVLELYRRHVYGRSPGRPKEMKFRVRSTSDRALDGRAIRKEVTVYFKGLTNGPAMDILIYLPKLGRPVPLFLGLNFDGNHSIHSDPEITLARSWVRNDPQRGNANNRATDAARGKGTGRWAVEKILERGYGLATIYYGDIEPDFAEGWKQGVRAQLRPDGRWSSAPLQASDFADDAWGAIAAWAWGLSRALDYFETDPHIDSRRVAVLGHSRLGKTALWAGAEDERFAIVISNNSGEGGAALSRRRIGETVERINTSFPHWFNAKFKTYNGRENDLPVDQHMLIALAAPRPVYVASASEDLWADPRGEFLSAKHAEPVYALFGKKGLGVSDMPPSNTPVGDRIGYHLREGKHDVTDYDWEQYLNFADRHLK